MIAATRQAADTQFPKVYSGHTRYREAPYHLLDKFIAHVQETSEPESFPGLYWGRLERTEAFEIIHSFSVDRRKRPGGDYIPCPMCQRKEKFLGGSLVFLFARQCIAIIGHDCASIEVRGAAVSRKKRDDARRHQEDFLMARLVDVPGMLREIRSLQSIAAEIERIHQTFKAGAPSIHKMLRQVKKSGGEYILAEQVENEAAEYDPRLPKKLTRTHTFGSLFGEALVATSCDFVVELKRIEQMLAPFDGCSNEDIAMNVTIELIDNFQAGKAVKLIGGSGRRITELKEKMAAAPLFFLTEHIDQLRAFAKSRLQPIPYDVQRQARSDGIAVVLTRHAPADKREYARLFLKYSLADWAESTMKAK